MENQIKICQSCGMPIDKDPNNGRTNADKSKSDRYCSFCYQDGKFTDEGITLKEKIEKNTQISVAMGFTELDARQLAARVLPNLERWKLLFRKNH
ncbi:MAG: zinc ribbon domain-containing protein [Lutibacter sp.]